MITSGSDQWNIERSIIPDWDATADAMHAVPHALHTGGRLWYQSPGEDAMVVVDDVARAPARMDRGRGDEEFALFGSLADMRVRVLDDDASPPIG